ncbi:hypothetical protein FGG08_002588 [Glutinoglossum americanum]|uniref:RING-type domain-containing protein n=1 Tax=Glutinoglossum americanum TaxID=1670608 RepID=A0A9P8HZX7_9PEZI|nr:hypothetical protein FGG08_002588 [Glutinoglossum americanum]
MPHPRRSVSESSTAGKSSFRALFSFHTPNSLFPPSAIISLTDDNSTFFLSRPAAFGPLLPAKGLSGQLWIGSGFGDDDNLRRNGMAAGSEGELGCSDVPGWGDGDKSPGGDETSSDINDSKYDASGRGLKKLVGGDSSVDRVDEKIAQLQEHPAAQDDGTDDYLHQPHQGSTLSKPTKPGRDSSDSAGAGKTPSTEHADIQSLQESAEITGKIVLLTRGGCGFLEKVKWTQRRGGIALIVGDNTRGGGLVTMYARGDTSNVTIPSLFTSHTTAHLLSSLIPPEGEERPDKNAVGGKGRKKTKKIKGWPTFTPTMANTKPTSTGKASRIGSGSGVVASPFQVKEKRSWLRIFLSKLGFGYRDTGLPGLEQDSRRPPSSGELDWVLVEHPTDEEKKPKKFASGKGKTPGKSTTSPESGAGLTATDDFEIGVQDWRDPDLVGMPSLKGEDPSDSTPTKANSESKNSNAKLPSADKLMPGTSGNSKNGKFKGNGRLPGGSITPSSGEYDDKNKPHGKSTTNNGEDIDPSAKPGHGWLSHMPWMGKDGGYSAHNSHKSDQESPEFVTDVDSDDGDDDDDGDGEDHQGLWVTLTPTSMSASPFFDTLLVLVVSPLVTLTVVYALLLLRSRIRRRRWRAPKSVVERLPVRTYHTLSTASSLSSLRIATPHSFSPTSPLLQSVARPISPRSRQRSHTASDVLESPEMSRSRLKPISEGETPRRPTFEKPGHPRTQRKRYVGHQEECVVCLEEYVDGVSRVMRLPCGHEFHADCITPWLTTRRRTCPICKGDVVRSISRNSSLGSRLSPYRDDLEDDEESSSPSSPLLAQNRASNGDGDTDLENGDNGAAPSLMAERQGSIGGMIWWRCRNIARSSMAGLRNLSTNFGSREARRRDTEERDR